MKVKTSGNKQNTKNANKNTDVDSNFYRDENGIVRSHYLTEGINALTFEFLDHGYFYGDERWNQFGVVSPYTRLYFMAKDSGWIETEEGRMDLLPGNMYLIPAFLTVNLRTKQHIEKFYIHLNCHYGGLDLLENLQRCVSLPIKERKLASLLSTHAGRNVADLLRFKSQVYEIVADFIQGFNANLHETIRLAEKYLSVHKYIANNLHFSLNYKEVALATGHSPDMLRVNYAKDMGITVTKYIHSQILQKATLELLRTTDNIKEIAANLGFNDEFYFSRFFKKRMQYSPRKYRKINGSINSYKLTGREIL